MRAFQNNGMLVNENSTDVLKKYLKVLPKQTMNYFPVLTK